MTTLFTACQKDDEQSIPTETNQEVTETPYQISRLFINDLDSDPEFQKMAYTFKLEEPLKRAKQAPFRKSSITNSGFSIKFGSTKKLVSAGKISYTFLIERDIPEANIFENLVIEKATDGSIRGYLMKYKSDVYWDEGSDDPFRGDISISPYSENLDELITTLNDQKSSSLQKAEDCNTVVHVSIFVEYSCTGSNQHTVDEAEDCNCGTVYACEQPHNEVYTFPTYVPCNDFSAPTNTNNTNGGQDGGGSGGVLGGGDGGTGTAILGPDGINVPNREFLVDGLSYAPYASTYANYFQKSWQLFKFMEETKFVKYDKPVNKPIYNQLKEITNSIYKKRYTLSKQDFEFLYGRQRQIISLLDAVNFDYAALPNAQKKQIGQAAAFMAIMPEAKTISSIWPKTEGEWAAIGELFAQFLPELALGFIPGSSIIDVIKGADQGDYVAISFGIAGLVADAFGGTIIKGVAKLGKIAFKTFKLFKVVHKFAKAAGVALKRGFKMNLENGVAVLKDSVGKVIAKGDNTVKEFLGIVNIPKGSRPNPSTYLDASYIVRHLEKFKDGASRIVKKSDFDEFGIGKPDVGKTEFVATKADIDEILKLPLEKQAEKLGIPVDQIKNDGLVRVDFKPTSKIELPSGNEFGANDQWIPGGITSGGVDEAIVKTEGMKEGIDYIVKNL
ncbi:hypothetical protein AWE51_07915 [Aquimarina aggregata]|uniref:Pre-toxin TG domain-containing protein n=1 Tax=Aquimarina aggregata TaxID=1642818 RepID=A0A162Z574_9FLAO|nr:hypothetical protein AWE51_07915 [Aquimarina aggregata]